MNSTGDFLTRHSLTTRMVHAAFAFTIVVQLLTSAVMRGPWHGRQGDWMFVVHEYAGLASMVAALGFWLVLVVRRRGTRFGLLFPWFSDRRLIALWDDIVDHAVALFQLRLPEHEGDQPLASAVHGAGLLLMTLLTVTGTIWFYGHYEGLPLTGFMWFALWTHVMFANLAWFYLIGHAGFGIIHHYTTRFSLRQMWSLERSK